MTGFGSAVCKGENISISVELKTVNSRYFKLSLRLTDGYGAMEQRVESLLRSAIERGTVNVSVRIVSTKGETGFQINTPVLLSYVEQLQNVAQALPGGFHADLGKLQLDQLVALPGVIVTDSEIAVDSAIVTEGENNEAENEKTWSLLEKALREALDTLQMMRKTEGESMAKDLAANLESLRLLIGTITELSPRVAPLYRQKLKERIEKVMTEHGLSLSEADFVRELAVYADRCDISEEIVRFQSHLEQFASAMQSQKCCGRKLDFLTQELFREANTIGSKANDAEITTHVVEIKTIIERIREMVQNVE